MKSLIPYRLQNTLKSTRKDSKQKGSAIHRRKCKIMTRAEQYRCAVDAMENKCNFVARGGYLLAAICWRLSYLLLKLFGKIWQKTVIHPSNGAVLNKLFTIYCASVLLRSSHNLTFSAIYRRSALRELAEALCDKSQTPSAIYRRPLLLKVFPCTNFEYDYAHAETLKPQSLVIFKLIPIK